jgi:uncharacterized protein YjbI with pentapeptide repeats
MHSDRVARAASRVAMLLFFIALLMSHESLASPLSAGSGHTGEDHSGENHMSETLSAIILTDATLASSNLRDSILDNAIAIRTDFSSAQLRGASFTGATLSDASFSGATLRSADFTGAWAAGADFTGANFRDATLAGVVFDGASLIGSNANGASFVGASFLGSDLSGITNVDPNAFSGAFYDFSTVLDPGFDTSQMVLVPEPRPMVFLLMGLLALGLLPDALRPAAYPSTRVRASR